MSNPMNWRKVAEAYLSTLKKLPDAEFLQGAMTFRTELMTLCTLTADLMDERERLKNPVAEEKPVAEPKEMLLPSEIVKKQQEATAAERERNYQLKAQVFCLKYGLDAHKDKEKILALISATNELKECTGCQGFCLKQIHRFETPVFSPTGEVEWKPCRVITAKRIWESLPEKYQDKTFADYQKTRENQPAIFLANSFISGKVRNIYLHGGVGTGKTFLATLIAKEMIRQGKNVIFGNVPSLLNNLKKAFNDPATPSQAVLHKYIHCDVLALDDIGAGYLTAWNVGILYDIIDGRDNLRKPTILTSNYSPEELARQIEAVRELNATDAARIYSRLKGICAEACLGTHDRRLDK